MVLKQTNAVLYFMDKKIGFVNIDFNKEKKKIGIRIKQIRKDRGYSSHETFANENDIDRAQYGKYEAGSSNITLATLIKILNILKINLSDFFNEDYENIKV